MIFFYDKHWYHSEPLVSVSEENEDEDEEDHEEREESFSNDNTAGRTSSPTPSQETVTSARMSSQTKKPEYEFILFNYLLRFVHREGKIGDFARAGLLFLMDVAMSPGVPVHHLAGEGLKSFATSSVTQPQSTGSDPIADAALALAEYILDGDFCEVLGAGLGAVYSLLPTKLEIHPDQVENTSQANSMIIGSTGPLTDKEKEEKERVRENAQLVGLEYSSSPEFKARLEHFMKLLEFLQDVLRRNVANISDNGTVEPTSFVGSAIVQTILDAVRRIFLENVLYPSILECSDVDGSAVAVMSYIDVMVRTLHDAQFAEMLIDFLVSEDDTERTRQQPRIRPTLLLNKTTVSSTSSDSNTLRNKKMKRRKSSAMMLLEMEAPDARRQSEYLTSMGRFTLKDLVLINMRSSAPAAVTAALQLMQSLLTNHCRLSVDRLFIFSYERTAENVQSSAMELKQYSDDDDEVFTYPGAEANVTPSPDTTFTSPELLSTAPDATYHMHERELGLYLGLVARIDPAHSQGAFSTGYDHYLRDALTSITSHACSTNASDLEEDKPRHTLDMNDPALSLVLQSLRHFYSNPPELNMALTGMLAAVAVCPERCLKGWLLFGSDGSSLDQRIDNDNTPQLFNDGDDRSMDFEINERLTRNDPPLPIRGAEPLSQPVVFSILQGLVSHIDRFRSLVDGFDVFLSERRQGLVFSENLTDALSLSFDLSNNITGVVESPRPIRADVHPPATPQRPKQKTKSSTWASLLTPKKSRSRAVSPAPSEPTTPASKGKTVETSPFGSHYKRTNQISVEALIAPIPSHGSWIPTEQRKFSVEEENVFGSSSQWGNDNPVTTDSTDANQESERDRTVKLSQLLDNVVILEESIKELTAIIHARRSLGIDTLRYL